MKHTPSLRRFASSEIDPSLAIGLSEDHPALIEGRTIFPSTVVASRQSPRFIISGHNNPKLGKEVLKGDRKGWPIFHLTLEERATCPRSCEQWSNCYGNAMPQARRHTPDADFLWLLRAEVATIARQLPKGLLIRLHALGDFYSVEYVYAWAELLAQFPQIHVFGYTARTVLDADPASARIARAIQVLTDKAWDRFAIRTSSSHPDVADSRAIVVDADPGEPDTIVCPAQTGASEACATCGLCWSSSVRGKTIAFLRHGMTARKSRTAPDVDDGTTKAGFARAAVLNALPDLFDKHPGGVRATHLATATGLTYDHVVQACIWLDRHGHAQWLKGRGERFFKVLLPLGATLRESDLTQQQARVYAAIHLKDDAGVASISLGDLATAADVKRGSVTFIVDALERKGAIEVVERGSPTTPSKYRIIDVEARGVAQHLGPKVELRRSARDAVPPRRVLTRALLGDPMPGRTPWAAPETGPGA